MKEPLVNRNGVLTFMSTQNYTYNMCLTQTPTKTNKNIASEQIFYGMERKWSCTNHHHQTPVELAQKTNSNKHLISFWFTSAINSIAQPFFSCLIMKSRSDNLFTNNITNIVILDSSFQRDRDIWYHVFLSFVHKQYFEQTNNSKRESPRVGSAFDNRACVCIQTILLTGH